MFKIFIPVYSKNVLNIKFGIILPFRQPSGTLRVDDVLMEEVPADVPTEDKQPSHTQGGFPQHITRPGPSLENTKEQSLGEK
jgi:hypothetical protein